jgi:anaerobic magnesium-protoporphyrin IX monomethyl ester cyclase
VSQPELFSILDSPGSTTLPRAAELEKDIGRPIVLIGFQRHSNLGIGYLASTLRQHGYRVEVYDFEADRQLILDAITQLDPIVVGFSLIFQSYVLHFRSLMQYLRLNGVTCHFTMGGHFPSLSYERTLSLLPELDTVVRFEGEITLLELVDLLTAGRDWHNIAGIAYRSPAGVTATELRALVHDLDHLPYPERIFRKNAVLGRHATPLLASRGCARTCSFCSIHMFYRTAPGKVVRTRKPAEVAREMRFLLDEHAISIFLFQDDDFPLFGPAWQRWTREFLGELHRQALPGRAVWKINCRADAVEPELFREMRQAGLYMVYMGLESGTEEGLKTLHKQISVEQNIRAVEILKSIGSIFEFGFMLLDPSSSFSSVRANVQFLRTIVGDGSAAAGFGRMVPYDGTPIKDELERTGRLRGDVCKPDYEFFDPRLNGFYQEILHIVDLTGWTHGYGALSPALNFAWDEVAILGQLFPSVPGLPAYQEVVREITRASNEVLFQIVEDTADVFSSGKPSSWSARELQAQSRGFTDRLIRTRDAFILKNQDLLLQSLERDAQTVCA